MFDTDNWQEIFGAIRKNKLRTFLTGFSVAWGIFILVILLGAGAGLENGVQHEFEGDARNTVRISGGQTSIPYEGMKEGRSIRLTNADYDRVKYLTPKADHFSARRWVWIENNKISYKQEYGIFDILGVHPGMKHIERTFIVKGRFINDADVKEARKVIVVSRIICDELFRHGEEPVGQYVRTGSIPFLIAGVYEDANKYDNRMVYMPVTTAQSVFAGSNNINNIMFTTGEMTFAENEAQIELIRRDFASRFRYDPNDLRALWIRDNLKNYRQFQELFVTINLFIWIIGLGTIAAGVAGVSNIMVIVVKERTREIGIRKALGAKPASIVRLVMLESVFITACAGYFGLAAGVGLLELITPVFENSESFFRHPQVNFGIAVGATAVLVIAGIIAGFIPARHAAGISPIVALRSN
ncbi:MAG: ABC transporter permease [Bacteroidales bacterium]|jgi:putative ABC transport system permease protein|nr:ABC transporter permease [Bacteroidales bacterium]